MIVDKPTWQFTARDALTDWYGHVHLSDGKAVGQWFCVDLQSGRRLWEHTFEGPNTICGISDGVIVATETKSGGPWTASFGAWGISVDTGKLLWPTRREVSWGRRLLELIPFVGPPVPGTAAHVEGSLCFCEGGKVLSIHTGNVVGEAGADPEEWMDNAQAKDAPWNFYMGQPLKLDNGDVLTRGSEDDEGFHLFRAATNGASRWHFDLAREGHFITGNYYSYRYSDGFVYMVVSERYRELTFDPAEPHGGHYYLWTLELQTGRLCQKVAIPDWVGECRIEDVDQRHVLISTANKKLFCYGRIQP